MRKILIAIAVLAVLYPPITWLSGFAVEHHFEQLVDQSRQMMPQLHLVGSTRRGVLTSDEDSSYEAGSTLKLTRHYHRGWFSSVDEGNIELPSFAPDGKPFRLTFRTVIHHGPICGWTCVALAGVETHMSASGPLQASLGRVFGDAEPLTLRGRVGFLGGGSATVSSPAVEHAPIGDTAFFSWGGLDARMHYGARQDWYDIAATAPSLRVEGAKGTLEIQGLSLDAHSKRALGILYEGDSRLEIKHLTVDQPDKPRFGMNDLLFANRSRAEGRFMNVSYQLGAGAIVTQPLALSSAHVDLTWKHLGLESLESLLAAMGQNQNAPAAPAARAQYMMAAIKQPLGALLLDEPELDIDRLSVASAQGQSLVTGVVRLVGVGAMDIEAPALLLRKLDASLDLAIDEAFLSSLPGSGAGALAQLQPMIDQGYFARSNGTLRTQIRFQGAQLSLNGKPFNPAAMRSPVSPPPAAAPVR